MAGERVLPKPYYDDGTVTIYNGEACAILSALPEASADVLMTDPPYSSGGAFRSDRNADPESKYSRAEVASYGTFGGDSRDQRSFMAWVSAWSWAALRCTRPSGHAFMFTDWRQLPSMTDALQLGGWTWRGLVVWSKGPSGGIPQRGKFRQNAEYAVWGTNGGQSDLAHGCPSSVIEVPSVPTADRQHVTQKPETLIRHLLSVVPQTTPVVLDPFMGSGTTLVAAKSVGARAIGIEVDERYCEIAASRLAQGVLG